MTTFAIIEDGVVTQLLVRDVLPPMHPSLNYVQVPDGTQRYQTFDGTDFGPSPTVPKPTFEQKMEQSDHILPRYAEDLADALVANGGTIPDALATKVANKKALRSAG
jgi:hypothetical protein